MSGTSYKRLTLFMAVMLVLALTVAACSGSKPSDSAKPSETAGAAKPQEQSPKQEPVTLRIELFDRGNTPPGAPPLTESHFVKYMQEQFGDPNNIKLEFVPVPRSKEVEELNVLLAANDAPDIIFTYDSTAVQNWAKQGGLADVGALIDEHGPNLRQYLQDLLPFGVISGKQYAIPGKRIIKAAHTPYIRKDWLDKLGLPLPQTTGQWYETMKAFKEKDPGNTGGKVIPWGFLSTDPFIRSFWQEMTEEEYVTTPDWVKPGNKEAYRFLNKMYNEDLLSPDFALDKDEKKFVSDLVNGLTGFSIMNSNEPVYLGYLNTLKGNQPDAELVPIDPFTNYAGKKPKFMYSPYAAFLLIPENSERKVEAIKFLDWLVHPDVIFALQNGIEGQTYTLDAEGIPIILETDEANKIMYNWYDYSILINGRDLGDPDKSRKANAAVPEYRDFTIQSFNVGETDGVPKYLFDRPNEAEIKYGSTLNEKKAEIHVKTITAKPEDFDKLYDALVEEYMKIGGNEVMEENIKIYKAMNP